MGWARKALFKADPTMKEDYSDLSPNPPEDPTAWRGARFRRLRNAATAGDANAAASARAGHGRGAPE